MLAIFDDQKPETSQGKVINLNKKSFGVDFEISINHNQCSVVTFQSPELTAQHTPVKINTGNLRRIVR